MFSFDKGFISSSYQQINRTITMHFLLQKNVLVRFILDTIIIVKSTADYYFISSNCLLLLLLSTSVIGVVIIVWLGLLMCVEKYVTFEKDCTKISFVTINILIKLVPAIL